MADFPKRMTVRDLMELLRGADPDRIVVVTGNSEVTWICKGCPWFGSGPGVFAPAEVEAPVSDAIPASESSDPGGPATTVFERYVEELFSEQGEITPETARDMEEKVFWPARLFYAGKILGAALAGRLPNRTGYAWRALQGFAAEDRTQWEQAIPLERAWHGAMAMMFGGELEEVRRVPWDDQGLRTACLEELETLASRIALQDGEPSA